MKSLKIILFWLIQCTWGIIMTLIGAIVALICLIVGLKPRRFGYSIYFVFGKNWGGIGLGGFFFVSKSCNKLEDKTHEAGHSLAQNLILGPFFPFIVGIPSAIRYYLFDYNTDKERKKFSLLITLIPITVGVVLLILGTWSSICWIGVVGMFVSVYAFLIFLWLFNTPNGELAKMNIKGYSYYGIWFESGASKHGMDNYTKNKEILKYE